MARFKKAYKGPFSKKEAEDLAADIMKENGRGKIFVIIHAQARKRKGKKDEYDVYVK